MAMVKQAKLQLWRAPRAQTDKCRFSDVIWLYNKQEHSSRGHVVGGSSMQGPNLERWQELCRQAAIEQDPKKLMALTSEIIRLLDEKEERILTDRGQAHANEAGG
jgi:hypothetical protein